MKRPHIRRYAAGPSPLLATSSESRLPRQQELLGPALDRPVLALSFTAATSCACRTRPARVLVEVDQTSRSTSFLRQIHADAGLVEAGLEASATDAGGDVLTKKRPLATLDGRTALAVPALAHTGRLTLTRG